MSMRRVAVMRMRIMSQRSDDGKIFTLRKPGEMEHSTENMVENVGTDPNLGKRVLPLRKIFAARNFMMRKKQASFKYF